MNSFEILASNANNATRYSREDKHEFRNNYQRDRDRILYSRAFRRLSGKTQVFLASTDDHARTRLTHTLEVAQIARTISRELGLNEDLTEAIALGHDLGHTPFGHVGERTLNHIMNGCYIISDFNTNLKEDEKGFKHNYQSIRVVNNLEEKPLNLCLETQWGMLIHSSTSEKSCKKSSNVYCELQHNKKHELKCEQKLYLGYYNDYSKLLRDSDIWNFEGLVVAQSDEIAQRHHDIEDAIGLGIIEPLDLIKLLNDNYSKEFRNIDIERIKEIKNDISNKSITNYMIITKFSTMIVDFLASKLIENCKKNLKSIVDEYSLTSKCDFYDRKSEIFKNKILIDGKVNIEKSPISLSEEIASIDNKFKEFIKNRILNSFQAQRMDGLGQYTIRKLFEAYVQNPQQLRDKTIQKLFHNLMMDNNISNFINRNYNPKIYVNYGEARDIISKIHNGDLGEYRNTYNQILLRTICDYISGMTDKFALDEHKRLYNISN